MLLSCWLVTSKTTGFYIRFFECANARDSVLCIVVPMRLHTFQFFPSFESVVFKLDMLGDKARDHNVAEDRVSITRKTASSVCFKLDMLEDEARDHNVAEDRVSITRKTGFSVRNDEKT